MARVRRGRQRKIAARSLGIPTLENEAKESEQVEAPEPPQTPPKGRLKRLHRDSQDRLRVQSREEEAYPGEPETHEAPVIRIAQHSERRQEQVAPARPSLLASAIGAADPKSNKATMDLSRTLKEDLAQEEAQEEQEQLEEAAELEDAQPPSTTEALVRAGVYPELREILQQVQSSSTQVDLTVQAFSKEVRNIAQRQLQYERRGVMSSVGAYVLFCVLIFGGLYFIFDLRASKNTVDAQYYETEFDNLSHRLSVAERELEHYRQSSHLAFEVLQLIEQGRAEDALERYAEVRDKLINPAESALLEERIEEVRWQQAEQAYQAGLSFIATSSFEQARDAFFQSQALKAETPFTHLLNYYLATSLFELGDFHGAKHYFTEALKYELPRDQEREALYRQAVSMESLGELEAAYLAYESFYKHNRYHDHSDDVVHRMKRIERDRSRNRSKAIRAKREADQED